MVGYLILLKMLNCKMKRKGGHNQIEDAKSNYGFETVTVKREMDEGEETICRVCLRNGNIPIFGNDSEDISDAVISIGGIEISKEDSFPKFLCKSCNELLQSALQFRKTAQQSDIKLKQPPGEVMSDDGDMHHDDDEHYEYKPGHVHKQNQLSATKTTYHCRKCDVDLKSLKDYNEHKSSLEHKNFRRTCPICKNSYTMPYYENHLALHRFETKYICDICGRKYVIKGQFNRHRLTHLNKFPFQCTLCPYRGKFKESLKLHMRSHTGERPYQCSQCPSRYVNKSNLNRHMLSHKPDHDYKCDSCGRGFYTRRDMELHFKVDHSGIKDHVCNLCGKAFGYRKQMMKHQLKFHKREKFRSGRMPLYLQVEAKKQAMVE